MFLILMLTARYCVILCNLDTTKGSFTTQHRGIEKLHCAKSPNRFKKKNSCKITLISQLDSTFCICGEDLSGIRLKLKSQ